jgi:hypothetical protein
MRSIPFEVSRLGGLNQEAVRANAILRELLVELALTLVPRGVTPKAFGELSRYAFACAAARISRRPNGKINHSRVAALTGISRADVKKLLQNTDSAKPTPRSSRMPIERVLNGWCTDRRFADKQGSPKTLQVSGSSTSFAYLTKLYGGDVPHRAVLDELQRIGAVRREGERVVLTMARARRGRPTFAALSSALPAIIDGIRVASRAEVSSASPAIYRLTIPAKSNLDLTILRERVSSTVTTMLNGLGESLGEGLTASKARQVQPHSFVVTVLLAENVSQESLQPMLNSLVKSRRAAKKKFGSAGRDERG